MRSLNNFRAEQPHQHAMYYLRLLMTEVAWTKDELREALDGEALLLIAVSLSLFTSVSKSQLLCLLAPFLQWAKLSSLKYIINTYSQACLQAITEQVKLVVWG